jgi:hypothetical protein
MRTLRMNEITTFAVAGRQRAVQQIDLIGSLLDN